jgi:hypothetical protein
MVLNRRLLGNYRTSCFAHRPRSKIVHPRELPTNLTGFETFPGAARLRRFPVIHTSKQIPRDRLLRAKAAPLQAWLPSCWRLYSFSPEILSGKRFVPYKSIGKQPNASQLISPYNGVTETPFLGIASKVPLSILRCALTNSGGV